MKIGKKAFAGTLESSDAFVEIAPGSGTLTLDIQSVVGEQFGKAIRASVEEICTQFGVDDAVLSIKDRGALDCTIRARVETAIKRSQSQGE